MVKTKYSDPDLASPNWSFLSRYDIIHDGELYLRRFRLFECPWFGIYFHKIYRPDRDRDLHDHPWPFISFVLRGWYWEEVPLSEIQIKSWYYFGDRFYKNTIRWFNKKKATDSHRISLISKVPVWTLILRGPRVRDWGFHTDNGWVKWDKYLGVEK